MSNANTYCYIDNQNSSNDCSDLNYTRIYSNKDSEVYKLNFYPQPPSMSIGPLNKNKPFNPGESPQNDLQYSNTQKINSPVSKNHLNTNSNTSLTNSLNYTNDSPISNNSTLSYAHLGHNSENTTVFTQK